jgi:hypothetical protein
MQICTLSIVVFKENFDIINGLIDGSGYQKEVRGFEWEWSFQWRFR